MEQLIRFSRRYGADPELTVAGGGNTSLKENGTLWVKASGTALATIREEDFVALSLQALLEIPEHPYPEEDAPREAAFLADILAARLPGSETKRPSVETLLHAFFPQRYVLHLHPNLVNGLTCSLRGKEEAARLFPDAAWVDECRPGYTLAMRLKEPVEAGADTVLMQNHGVFFAADTPEELDRMLTDMLAVLTRAVETGWRAEDYTPARPEKPFTPDQIVYCGLGPEIPDTEGARGCFAGAQKIARYAAAFGGQRPMADEMIAFITHWEAESYRRKQQ